MAYVIQPLAEPEQAPHDDDPSCCLTPVDAMSVSADASGQGLALLVLFTVAVLVVTGAVGLLALLTSWWVLGVAFAVHVLVTVLGTGKPSVASDDRVQLKAATSPVGPAQSRASSGQTSLIAA